MFVSYRRWESRESVVTCGAKCVRSASIYRARVAAVPMLLIRSVMFDSPTSR